MYYKLGQLYFIKNQCKRCYKLGQLHYYKLGQVLLQFFFFYLGFLSRPFTNNRTAGEWGGHSFNSSLPLPPASQTFKHQPGDYCRELTSAHSQQPDSNRKPLVSKRKSLNQGNLGQPLLQNRGNWGITTAQLPCANDIKHRRSMNKDLKFTYTFHIFV